MAQGAVYHKIFVFVSFAILWHVAKNARKVFRYTGFFCNDKFFHETVIIIREPRFNVTPKPRGLGRQESRK